MSNRFQLLTLLVSFLGAWALFPSSAVTDDDILRSLEVAKENLTGTDYLLRYKYAEGEEIQYSIEHLVSIDTTISGNNQKTKLRSKSTRSLKIEAVTGEGNIRFAHVVNRVDMWSEVGGREAVHYASDQDGPPPPEYQQVAEHVGKPISVITIDSTGRIIDRNDLVQHPDLGLGGLCIPMPKEPIRIGHAWSQPLEIRVRLEDGRVKAIKTRELYQLEKVETGVATISVKTQILTPVDNARVKSQIVQRISQGELRFDIDAGRLLSKKLEWDEAVLGFNGADSNMKYLAQFTEQLVPPDRTASRP